MYIGTIWQDLWNDETRNKCYEIPPNLKRQFVQWSQNNPLQTRICHDQTPDRSHMINAVIDSKGKTNQFAMLVTALTLWGMFLYQRISQKNLDFMIRSEV